MVLSSAPFHVGCSLDLSAAVTSTAHLFSELGGVVVEVPAARWGAFESQGVRVTELGRTTENRSLEVRLGGGSFDISADDLARAHAGTIGSLLMG
jgi:hypothetical protein